MAAESTASSSFLPGIPQNAPFNLFQHDDFNGNPTLRRVPLTVEVLDDFKADIWCPGLTLNMEEIPSEESDALREAFRNLGFGDVGYTEAVQGHDGVLGEEPQLQQLHSQLREEAEEQETEAEQAPQKVCSTSWNVAK